MAKKTRIDRLERLARRLTPPGDRVTVIEVYGYRDGAGPELLEVIRVGRKEGSNDDKLCNAKTPCV